ncbi:MAG TPA: hypothetical protein DEB31_04745 [Clostridiales bacterium]|nr:hypothetical protein [Clostridiales bacterium]
MPTESAMSPAPEESSEDTVIIVDESAASDERQVAAPQAEQVVKPQAEQTVIPDGEVTDGTQPQGSINPIAGEVTPVFEAG